MLLSFFFLFFLGGGGGGGVGGLVCLTVFISMFGVSELSTIMPASVI